MDIDFIKVILRRLRLIRVNRNFLVFLIFLGISIGFWFLQTLKEDVVMTFNYKFEITGMPNNIILTTNIPKEIKINCTGHGWNILQMAASNDEKKLEISFNEVRRENGRINIEANTLMRAAQKKLPKEVRFLSASPNKIEVFYSNGHHKRVPVRFNGKITTGESRYECGIVFKPDSVDIYAPNNLFESIKSISTKSVTFQGLEDTLVCMLPLEVPNGVKAVPDSISTKICIDLFTDKTISVPIYSENTPRNMVMRTFPLQSQVTFLVSSSFYESIADNDFLLVVDYNEVKANSNKCKIHIRQKPENIRQLRLSPEYVEFVIEQQTE